MKIAIQLCLFILLGFESFSQPNPREDIGLTVFDSLKEYHYKAIYIGIDGDTLSNEKIVLKPTGKPWKFQKSQTAYRVIYKYSKEDSIKISKLPNPTSVGRRKQKPIFLEKEVTTGALENPHELWMHPFRENQYVYTEIAPFPDVRKDSLEIGAQWKTRLNIMIGLGSFKGKVNCQYNVVGKGDRKYKNLLLKDCWEIESTGTHSKLGVSQLNFYYHKKYGFVELNYRFYDGTIIQFSLLDVIELYNKE